MSKKTPKASDMWTKLEIQNSVTRNGVQYRNMQAWQRKCALCDIDFIEYMPGRAPADVPPSVTTCEEHRGAPNGITAGWLAWDGKNVVPGKRMKIGAAGVAVSSDDAGEVAALKKELAEAYEGSMEHMQEKGIAVRKYQTVMEENSKLKAELHALKAVHELKPALEAAKPFDGHAALAKELATKNNSNSYVAVSELAPAMDAIKTELERRLENNSNSFPWGVDNP